MTATNRLNLFNDFMLFCLVNNLLCAIFLGSKSLIYFNASALLAVIYLAATGISNCYKSRLVCYPERSVFFAEWKLAPLFPVSGQTSDWHQPWLPTNTLFPEDYSQTRNRWKAQIIIENSWREWKASPCLMLLLPCFVLKILTKIWYNSENTKNKRHANILLFTST